MHVGFDAWVVFKFISTGLYSVLFFPFSFNFIMTATLSSRKSVQKQNRTKREGYARYIQYLLSEVLERCSLHTRATAFLRVNFKGRLFWKDKERERGQTHTHRHTLFKMQTCRNTSCRLLLQGKWSILSLSHLKEQVNAYWCRVVSYVCMCVCWESYDRGWWGCGRVVVKYQILSRFLHVHLN